MTTDEHAYSLKKLDFSPVTDDREKYYSNLKSIVEKVQRARSGFDDLQTREKELQRRADALQHEITRAGGAAVAARALGLAGAALGVATSSGEAAADVSILQSDLTNVLEELRETRAAVEAAPGLFPKLLSELDAARALGGGSDWNKQFRTIVECWISEAQTTAKAIIAEADFLYDRLLNYTPSGVSVPADLRAIDPNDMMKFSEQSTISDTAKNESRPLVSPSPPSPRNIANDWDELHRRVAEKNRLAEIEWRRKRREAELAESQSAPHVAATAPSTGGGHAA